MYHPDCAMLQRLIIELDDTGNLYSNLSRMLLSPHLKHVVEQTVLTHQAIAEDLATHLYMMDAKTVSRDGRLGKLRARYGAWRMAAGADVEMGCLRQIERCEAQLVEHFFATTEYAPGLQRRLYRHLGELERISAQIASTLDEMGTHPHQLALRTAGNPDGCSARNEDAAPKAKAVRPRMDHNTPSYENPIRRRNFHATPATRRMTATRRAPCALDPTLAGANMYRSDTLPTDNSLPEST